MPKVSVLMPILNEEKYIRHSIESILNQTFQDFELLILDDYSTDNSPKIIDEFSGTDKRIKRVIAGPNRIGFTKSLNFLLKSAKGEYVCIIGGDDIFMSNRLEEAVKFHKNNPDIGASYSDYQWIDDEGGFIREVNCMEFDIRLLIRMEYVNLMTMMIRKSCLDDIGGFDEELKLSQDSLMKLEMGKKFGMKRIPQTLIKYRIRKGSITTAKADEQRKYLEKAVKKFVEKYPEFRESKINIGVPVYNPNMRYFKECLESIKIQTFRNYDVVVVDDGSDNGKDIEDMVSSYGYIYVRQENKGIGGARNTLIDNITGDAVYHCQLSCDDLYHPDYLKEMCILMEKNRGCILYCNIIITNESGQVISEVVSPKFDTSEDFCVCCLEKAEHNTMFVNFSSTMFPVDMIKRERFDGDLRYGEDLEFLLRTALIKKIRYVNLPKPLVKIRIHSESETTRKTDNIAENNKKILKKIGEMVGWQN